MGGRGRRNGYATWACDTPNNQTQQRQDEYQCCPANLGTCALRASPYACYCPDIQDENYDSAYRPKNWEFHDWSLLKVLNDGDAGKVRINRFINDAFARSENDLPAVLFFVIKDLVALSSLFE